MKFGPRVKELTYPASTIGLAYIRGRDANGHAVEMRQSSYTVQATDGGTDFSEACQDMMNYITALDQGAELYIPSGKFKANTQIEWKPRVSIRASPRAVIQANASMAALLATNVGSSSRLRGETIQGGIWAGNFLANKIIWLRDFQSVRAQNLSLAECDGTYLHAGDPSQSANCYELRVDNLETRRSWYGLTPGSVSTAPSGNIGLELNISDSELRNIVTNEADIGIKGALYQSVIHAHHHWNFYTAFTNALWMTGNHVDVYSAYADGVFTSAFKLTGDRYSFYGGKTLYDHSLAFSVDNSANVFEVANSGNLSVFGFRFRATNAAKRIASDFTGTLSNVRCWDPMYENVASAKMNNLYFRNAASCHITTAAGVDPTVDTQMNIASVTRNSDSDYTFNFSRSLGDAYYTVAVDFLPNAFPQTGISWQIRDKQTGSVRLQFYDNSGTTYRPATVSIRVFGK
jgi:hypothetical protein